MSERDRESRGPPSRREGQLGALRAHKEREGERDRDRAKERDRERELAKRERDRTSEPRHERHRKQRSRSWDRDRDREREDRPPARPRDEAFREGPRGGPREGPRERPREKAHWERERDRGEAEEPHSRGHSRQPREPLVLAAEGPQEQQRRTTRRGGPNREGPRDQGEGPSASAASEGPRQEGGGPPETAAGETGPLSRGSEGPRPNPYAWWENHQEGDGATRGANPSWAATEGAEGAPPFMPIAGYPGGGPQRASSETHGGRRRRGAGAARGGPAGNGGPPSPVLAAAEGGGGPGLPHPGGPAAGPGGHASFMQQQSLGMRPRGPLPPQAALAAHALGGGGAPGPDGPWGPRDGGGPMPVPMGGPGRPPQGGRGRGPWMPFGGPMGLRPPFGPMGGPGMPPFLHMGGPGGPHGHSGAQGGGGPPGGPLGPPHLDGFPIGPNGMPMEGAPRSGGPSYGEGGGGPSGAPASHSMQPPPPPFVRGGPPGPGGPGGPHSPGLGPEVPPSPLAGEFEQRRGGPPMGAPPMMDLVGGPHPRGGPPPFFLPPHHLHMQGGPGMPPPPPPEAFGMHGPPQEWMHGPGGPLGPPHPMAGGPPMGPLMHPSQGGDPQSHAAAADTAAAYHRGDGSVGLSGQAGGPAFAGPHLGCPPMGPPAGQRQQQQEVVGAPDAADASAPKTEEDAEEEALFSWLEQALLSATPEKLMLEVGPLLRPKAEPAAASAASAAAAGSEERPLRASALKLLLELKEGPLAYPPQPRAAAAAAAAAAAVTAAGIKGEEGGKSVQESKESEGPRPLRRLRAEGAPQEAEGEEGAPSLLPPLHIHRSSAAAAAANGLRTCSPLAGFKARLFYFSHTLLTGAPGGPPWSIALRAPWRPPWSRLGGPWGAPRCLGAVGRESVRYGGYAAMNLEGFLQAANHTPTGAPLHAMAKEGGPGGPPQGAP
ncbi:hypothetical protein Emag_002399 [Eimeria magna]